MTLLDVLLAAAAFIFILEGLLPTFLPKSLRAVYQQISSLPDKKIRRLGLVSLALGVLFLWMLVNR